MADEPLRLAYKKYGDGDPLVILHGLLGSSANWHTLARSVFCRYFTVYTIDQRNHGRSPHSERIDYPTMAADLLHFFDEHGIEKAALIGHSMGGKTAMEFALSHADRLSRLLVVDMAPRKYPPSHDTILEALRSVDLSKMSSRADVDQALADRIPDPATRRFLLKNLAYSSADGTYNWEINLDAIHANYDRINAAIDNGRKFEGPALFVRGSESNYISKSDEKTIKKFFPQAEFATVEGAGHWVHADRPESFAEVAVGFLT